jgi:hypothetical protein
MLSGFSEKRNTPHLPTMLLPLPPGLPWVPELPQLLLGCCYGLLHLRGAWQLLQLSQLLLQLRLQARHMQAASGTAS